ncbi:MAG TPA: hypothetical protein VIB55_12420 [Longimicrobium sp.]
MLLTEDEEVARGSLRVTGEIAAERRSEAVVEHRHVIPQRTFSSIERLLDVLGREDSLVDGRVRTRAIPRFLGIGRGGHDHPQAENFQFLDRREELKKLL